MNSFTLQEEFLPVLLQLARSSISSQSKMWLFIQVLQSGSEEQRSSFRLKSYKCSCKLLMTRRTWLQRLPGCVCVVGSDWIQQQSSAWFHVEHFSLLLLLFYPFIPTVFFLGCGSKWIRLRLVYFQTFRATFFHSIACLKKKYCWRCSFPPLPRVLKPQPLSSVWNLASEGKETTNRKEIPNSWLLVFSFQRRLQSGQLTSDTATFFFLIIITIADLFDAIYPSSEDRIPTSNRQS